jgi:hypothetical protein
MPSPTPAEKAAAAVRVAQGLPAWPTDADWRQKVTDYLKKKGFTKTEAVFRQETAHLGPDGRPAQRNDDSGPKKYLRGFILLRDWIDNNLDIYKVSRHMRPDLTSDWPLTARSSS